MKWFTEVFLPSIDINPCSGAFLSEKQVAVCRRYMKDVDTYGHPYIVVGGYKYSITEYKKGYGRIYKALKETAIY